VLNEDDIRRLGGLTDAEAAARLRGEGPNALPSTDARSVLAVALDVATEPMILLLIGCGTVYFLLGDAREAVVLLASVIVVVAISLYQTEKTERVLETLRDLSTPRALVIRDGREQRIAGRDVVRGDLLVLAEGDRVAADGLVLWSANLSVDESLLTGESVPVTKLGDDARPQGPTGDGSRTVYAGTLVGSGHGIARVEATGPATELGKIGTSIQAVPPAETRLQGQVRVVVRIVAIAGVAICAAVAIGYGLARASWLEGALAGLALAMSLMPEEFAVILTLFLALGAWRISRRNVLVRRMPALEALGATTVLCVDKTGTLTENRMAVTVLSTIGARHAVREHEREPLPEEFHQLLEFAVLASQQSPFDPMERAINELGRARLAGTEHLHATWTLVREYPLSRELLAISHAWRAVDGRRWVVAAKGAPEAIVDLCHLDAARAAVIADEVRALADQGLRVLGVASALFDAPELPASQHDFPFAFHGLLALSDPIRATAPSAVAECARAGIRTVMITGDYPGTARNVAAQIGLAAADQVLTGAELDALTDAELAHRIPGVGVFARVVPEQKRRLVHALKSHGGVVAMTGDGVNDAPALKTADIGIAMGKRGTDVAREAADLVLMDDDFSSIAAAIRLGRRVYANIRKAMTYVIAIHIPIAGLALVPVILGWPLVLLPIHILFLELIIDPACSIAFEGEPEEEDVMQRPPRDPHEPLFRARTISTAVLQGTLALLLTCGVLVFAVVSGYGEARSRTLTFATLVFANLGLILANRSTARGGLGSLRVPNPALWWVLSGALATLLASFAAPPLRSVLRFDLPSGVDLAIVAGMGMLGLVGFDALKGVPWGRHAVAPLLLGAATVVFAGTSARAEPGTGELLYRRYCASCHGESGRGDGPAGAALCPKPSDLTRLESDVSDLMRQIDGRRTIRAHGTAAMPVWGTVFEQSLIAEPRRRRTALQQVEMLADYVRRLRSTAVAPPPAGAARSPAAR
jgi:Ca2+-transporting ATPase